MVLFLVCAYIIVAVPLVWISLDREYQRRESITLCVLWPLSLILLIFSILVEMYLDYRANQIYVIMSQYKDKSYIDMINEMPMSHLKLLKSACKWDIVALSDKHKSLIDQRIDDRKFEQLFLGK